MLFAVFSCCCIVWYCAYSCCRELASMVGIWACRAAPAVTRAIMVANVFFIALRQLLHKAKVLGVSAATSCYFFTVVAVIALATRGTRRCGCGTARSRI